MTIKMSSDRRSSLIASDSKSMLSTSVPTSDCFPSTSGSSGKHHQVRYSFQKKPFVIGVAGGTASGKSTVCTKIIERLGPIDPKSIYLSHEKRVVRISQDSFYRKLTDEDRKNVEKGLFDFDHPSAFDSQLMFKTLKDVCDGKMVKVPQYNYNDNEISDLEEKIYPSDVVLVEGFLLFYFPELRKLFHMKIFVDTDADTRLSRRVIRDVKERNRDLTSVLEQYFKFVKPSFEEYCLPTKKYADIVVPRGPENEVAVDLIVTRIRSVYDPSTRHQSIKYPMDDDDKRGENEFSILILEDKDKKKSHKTHSKTNDNKSIKKKTNSKIKKAKKKKSNGNKTTEPILNANVGSISKSEPLSVSSPNSIPQNSNYNGHLNGFDEHLSDDLNFFGEFKIDDIRIDSPPLPNYPNGSNETNGTNESLIGTNNDHSKTSLTSQDKPTDTYDIESTSKTLVSNRVNNDPKAQIFLLTSR